jgi:hypothetical protein
MVANLSATKIQSWPRQATRSTPNLILKEQRILYSASMPVPGLTAATSAFPAPASSLPTAARRALTSHTTLSTSPPSMLPALQLPQPVHLTSDVHGHSTRVLSFRARALAPSLTVLGGHSGVLPRRIPATWCLPSMPILEPEPVEQEQALLLN